MLTHDLSAVANLVGILGSLDFWFMRNGYSCDNILSVLYCLRGDAFASSLCCGVVVAVQF